MKRILLLLIISSPLLANKLIIEKDLILAPEKLGALKLIRSQGEFEIMKGSKIRKINSYDVDPVLRKMNNEQLTNVLVGAKIRVSQFSNKDYKLELAGGLKGGGVGGATLGFYAGKFLVHFIGHGTILVVSALTGPAAPATAAALEATFLPAIEAASNVGGIAGGIIGGTASGPL